MSLLVSVIVPVHNATAYLDECLGSVAEQSYRPIEVRQKAAQEGAPAARPALTSTQAGQ